MHALFTHDDGWPWWLLNGIFLRESRGHKTAVCRAVDRTAIETFSQCLMLASVD